MNETSFFRKRRKKYKKSTIELAGSGAKYATTKEMKKHLDQLRKEDT